MTDVTLFERYVATMKQFQRFRILKSLVVFAGLLWLAGCAPSQPKVRFVWPPPPDVPRLEWVGVYYSEASFEKSDKQKLMAQIFGDAGEYTFKAPFGIASNGKGIVYISDIYDHNVRIYDFNRKKVEFLTKQPVMKTPLGLDVDNQGNLYIADGGLGKVLVFSKDRRLSFAFGGNKEILIKPAYLKVNERLDRIYVSDPLEHKIVVFDMQGHHLFSFGTRGNGPGEFFSPQGVAIDNKDRVFVADMLNARVQVFDAEGNYLYNFGERGDGVSQFENPKDLDFDSEGNLHVVDSRRSTLYTYRPDGTLLLATGTGKATKHLMGFAAPKSVFIDTNDRIYVAEALGKRFAVWQFMSKAYLQRNPYTEADKKRWFDYMEKMAGEQKKP
ncbi:MAG: 6-bladed beta-propeller [Chloroflexi bacterium]|nr:MAG: 6-bladed beta-propeller [Chloroflexota bacterium]